MLRSLYLLWLPIAFLAISVRSHEEENFHLNARNALASEIDSIHAEFGEDSIDTSLEGYDHELIARDESLTPSTWETVRDLPAKAARILKPHHKVVAPDEDWEPISKRELIEHQKRAMKAMYGGEDIDFSLEGYDEDLLDADDDEDLEKRDVDEEEKEGDIDYSLEGYDTALLEERDIDPELEEPEEKEEGVDYSLEGYDTSVLSERDLDEEDELPEGDGAPYDADFDYLSAWSSDIHARDFADDDDILGTAPDAEIGPEDDEVDANDRYFDDETVVATGAVRRDAKPQEADEDDQDWLEVVKRWIGLE